MFEFKLQVGCLIVVMYIIIMYVKETIEKHIECNKFFDALLYVIPSAIFFDGATAWSVNNMDACPLWLNLVLHCIFLCLMDITSIFLFIYMLNVTIGIKRVKKLPLMISPGIISLILTLVTIKDLNFVEGITTNYSLGLPVYASFASVFLYFLMIIVLIIQHHRNIEKKKIFALSSFIALSFTLLLVQLIFSEVLISAIVPTLTILGIYMSFEDPNSRRLQNYNDSMVTNFSTLVENRDNNTGGHIKRTKEYVRIILHRMDMSGKYRNELTKDYILNVIKSAPMHDIGKIGTPDRILQKPGKLTDEEYDIMKQHSALGGEIIKETFSDLDDSEFNKIAYEVARHHHEKWNGFGYPDKLKETEIPLHARVMAIADVFDAVSAKRVYRDAMPIEKCFAIIEEGSGRDFDPELVKLFMEARNEIMDYYSENKD